MDGPNIRKAPDTHEDFGQLRSIENSDGEDELDGATGMENINYEPLRWADKIQLVEKSSDREDIGNMSFSMESLIAKGCEGNMVYVGLLDKETPVAVKQVRTQNASKERQIVSRLQGKTFKHLLQPLSVLDDKFFTYFLTPLCEYNLEELMDNPYPMRSKFEAAFGKWRESLCMQFLTGLKELHGIPMMHRDIKPSNVLIESSGKLLISDFGLSRTVNLGKSTYRDKSWVGTMCWSSTEVSNAEGREFVEYKRSSDIQVAACLVYYILTTGHIPHEDTSPYTDNCSKVVENLKSNKYSLKHLPLANKKYEDIIKQMIVTKREDRPKIEVCYSHFLKKYKT